MSPTAVANYGGETSVFAGREVNIPSKRMGTIEEVNLLWHDTLRTLVP